MAGLPELLRAYGAERAWARVCAALRGALHEAPPLEGLEPLALPLPGGEAEARCTPRPRHRGPCHAPALAAPHRPPRHCVLTVLAARAAPPTPRPCPARQARLALLDAPGGLLPLLSAAELQLAASPPPGAEALLHASVARLAASSAHGGEGGGGGALLSPSAKGQAFVLRHYHAPIKYECALLLLGVRRLGLGLGLAHPSPNPNPSPSANPNRSPSPNPSPNPEQVRRSVEPCEAALLCLQASSLPHMRTLLAGRGARGAARSARRGGGGSSSLLATQLSAMRELVSPNPNP